MFNVVRTRSKTLPFAIPLASHASIALRNAASFASRAFSYRRVSTFSSTKRSNHAAVIRRLKRGQHLFRMARRLDL
jgi:hypothetical protein